MHKIQPNDLGMSTHAWRVPAHRKNIPFAIFSSEVDANGCAVLKHLLMLVTAGTPSLQARKHDGLDAHAASAAGARAHATADLAVFRVFETPDLKDAIFHWIKGVIAKYIS